MANHEGYEYRLHFVDSVLESLGLKSSEVKPLAYEEDCPFPYNNFLYHIELSEPWKRDNSVKRQPCTVLLPPDGVSSLVLRFGNPAVEDFKHDNRIQNEVASMQLARQSLEQRGLTGLVPDVYAWKAFKEKPVSEKSNEGNHDFGWMLMQHRPGVSLGSIFPKLNLKIKKVYAEQIGAIVAAIQGATLPETVTEYGGLTILSDADGQIKSAPSTFRGGPWATVEAAWQYVLEEALTNADGSPAIKGWKANGVRERLDAFVNDSQGGNGLKAAIKAGGVDSNTKVLGHIDLTMDNMLVDETANRITSILDFDFASITHPSSEFGVGPQMAFSLHDVLTSDEIKDEVFNGQINKRSLGSAQSANQEDGEKQDGDDRAVAAAWHSSLERHGAITPRNINGISTSRRLRKLVDTIAPFPLVHPIALKQSSAEELEETRAAIEAELIKLLGDFGV